jgi:hypothetical protein
MPDDKTKKFFIDLEKIRPTGGGRGAVVQEVLTTIPVRKPRRLEFIRTSPDPAMWQDTTIFVDETDRSAIFYVPPEIRGEMLGATKDVILVPTITAQRVLMLWPLNLPADDGRHNYWTETALEAAELGKTAWIRVGSDMSLGAYRVFRAEDAETLEPEWPKMPLADLLAVAFNGRVIDTPEHPIIRRLRSPR